MSNPRWLLFSDESGISSDYRCYGIGVLAIREDRVPKLNAWFETHKRSHGISGEVKWKRIDNKSYGRINFALELLEAIMMSSARLEIIVVHKESYRQWRTATQEDAFYKMYTYLLNHALEGDSGEYVVVMDDRTDRYAKRDEVVAIIANRMRRNKVRGRLEEVGRGDSRLIPGIQMADLLCGAVTAACNIYLQPKAQIKAGKLLLIERLAGILGWDHLCYDTYPNSHFNIWHFPVEWRGTPATRRVPAKPRSPNYVTADELASLK